MSVLDLAAKVEDTGFRRPVKTVAINCIETGNTNHRGLDDQTEYEMTATFKKTFWANRAQLPGAREAAVRALNHHLYSDVLSLFSILRLAIDTNDEEEALRIMSSIEQAINL